MGSPEPGDDVRTAAQIPQQRVRITEQRSSGPGELPRTPRYFTNRAADLDELARQLDDFPEDELPVQVICGPGGVGKTALATAWGHRVLDRFPDGALWADLGGFSTTGPLDEGEVLGRFLVTLGVPGNQLPATTDARAALFRTQTRDRALLILLDNARTHLQVAPLLPSSPRCLVVITSRRRLGELRAEHGAEHVELAPFTATHSAQLLGRVLGKNRVEAEAKSAEQITELCGGLPIALTLISAKLFNRPGSTLAGIVRELSRQHRPLAVFGKEATSVEASFNLSYDDLPPDAAALYHALGQHPGPEFGAGVAAAAVAASESVANELLGRLIEVGLLVVRGEDRYTFHDLVRLHAREKMAGHENARDRETVLRRMVEWYLASAQRTADLTTPDQDSIPYEFEYPPQYVPEFDGRDEALAWLELERPNLISAVRAATEAELYETGWQLAAAMWPLFLLHKHYPDFLQVSQDGVKCARRWGHKGAEALMHNRSGAASRGSGAYEDATRHYLAGRDAAREARDEVVEIRSVEGLGLVALQRGEFDDALRWFTEDHELSRRQDRAHDVGLALINLGATHARAGRPADAITALTQARDLLGEQGDEYNVARVRIELGRALGATGEFAAARTELEQAHDVMVERGSAFEAARAIQAFGEVAEAEGDVETAKQYYDQALPVFVGLGRPEADAVRERLGRL